MMNYSEKDIIEIEREKLNWVTDGSYVTRIFIDFLISEWVQISQEQKRAICYIAWVARFIDNLIDGTPLPKEVIIEWVSWITKFIEIENVANMLANSDQVEFFIQQTVETIQATLQHADKENDPLWARVKECKSLVNWYLSPLYFDLWKDTNFLNASNIMYQIWIVSYLVSDVLWSIKDKRLWIHDLIRFWLSSIKELFTLYCIVTSKSWFFKMCWKITSHGILRRYYRFLWKESLSSYEAGIKKTYDY